VSILEELKWRGLIADYTDKAMLDECVKTPITLYCGFDPTADSLHVGNLVPLLALRRFQDAGHFPIAVAGGATGSIGDPSGKTQERQLLTKEVLEHNISRVKEQLKRLLRFEGVENKARLVDNASWTVSVSYLDFLRDIGKHFSVNQMVAKESIRARMEDREVGISYTEFSYMLLQAFDFYILNCDYQCELQIGGSDQWGNITAGIDLIRKKAALVASSQPVSGWKTGSVIDVTNVVPSPRAFGLTLPLITNADGTKFGKTEAGAIWLDPKKTSVYKFYQFWINTDDRDVIRYLKYFTLPKDAADVLPARERINELEKKHLENPDARIPHKKLAAEMTFLIHGYEAMQSCQMASDVLFGGSIDPVKEDLFVVIRGEVPTIEIERTKLEGAGFSLVELLVHAKLSQSKGQARKDIEGGGVYVNNNRETSLQRAVTVNDLPFGADLLLRKGKKNYVVVTAK
jgi:tyrosyl-tRNA synthetase